MKPMTLFRSWVHNLWIENCEEHFVHAEPVLEEREYFQRYKYWLKREYRHYQRENQKKILAKSTVDKNLANCYNKLNMVQNSTNY